MLDYKVVSLHNKSNQFSIVIYQRTRTEFKIRTQVGFNSYSNDYVFGMYELARTCFCYLINNYSLVTNNLGYSFAYAIHSGDFTELEEPIGEPPLLTRCDQFRTAYERAEEPTEDLLIRTENVTIEDCPWKLAN